MLRGIASLLIAVLLSVPLCFGQSAQEKRSRLLNDSLVKADREFGYIHNLDSLLRVINAEQDSMLRKSAEQPMKEKKAGRFLSALFRNAAVQIFFWVALLAFIGFIIYKLFNIQLVPKKELAAKADEYAEDELLKPENWYLNEIHRAESENDFIVAIRCRFMQMLSLMDAGKLIEFLPGKTNAAYAAEINDAGLKTHFRQLSLVYEYVWYGKKTLSPDQYASLKPLFEKTEKLVK